MDQSLKIFLNRIFILLIIGLLYFIWITRYELIPVSFNAGPAAYKLNQWTGKTTLILVGIESNVKEQEQPNERPSNEKTLEEIFNKKNERPREELKDLLDKK